jgi:aspartate-semialdehyde dehydrogenase
MNNMKTPKKFPRQIAFNVIPMIGSFLANGYTDEEMKMVNETKKILDKNIEVTVTCVRVPVFNGHSEAVNIEFENPLSPEEAREILREAPGISVVDDPMQGRYITPVESSTEHDVYVSRIRRDLTIKNGLNMWVVADNLRKGAALNAVQIAEYLVENCL